jgi:hypothetical protein
LKKKRLDPYRRVGEMGGRRGCGQDGGENEEQDEVQDGYAK